MPNGRGLDATNALTAVNCYEAFCDFEVEQTGEAGTEVT
jgi:hypothetical protein